MTPFVESQVEEAALAWFEELGYPPDLPDAAVQNVLQRAEALSSEWAA